MTGASLCKWRGASLTIFLKFNLHTTLLTRLLPSSLGVGLRLFARWDASLSFKSYQPDQTLIHTLRNHRVSHILGKRLRNATFHEFSPISISGDPSSGLASNTAHFERRRVIVSCHVAGLHSRNRSSQKHYSRTIRTMFMLFTFDLHLSRWNACSFETRKSIG